MRSSHLALTAAALLGLQACGCTPELLEDCPDAACWQRWLEASSERDPALVVSALRALPEGPDRATLLQVAVERWPGQTEELCPLLPQGPARARCATLNERPHLWQVDIGQPDESSKGTGKAYPTLAVELTELRDPWRDLRAREAACEGEATQASCRSAAARRAAHDGRVRSAGQLCLGIEDKRWRSECFFQASEVSWEPRAETPGDPAHAAELCLGAGPYLFRCLGHLAGKVGRTAPAASRDAPEEWERVGRHIAGVHTELSDHHLELASRWRDLAWTYAMATAYDNVVRPTGNPTDHTPLYAWPHVVAAVCWVLWRAEGDQPRDIDAWLTRVQHAMRARTDDPTVQPASQELDDAAIGWLQDLPGEERLPWLAYRGSMSRRALAGDPDTDAVICLLEAAARNPTARQEALFRQALDHPKRSVRWTAARLGAKHVPQALEGVAAGSEEDALVRARLLAPR